jgi:hypothetical protein
VEERSVKPSAQPTAGRLIRLALAPVVVGDAYGLVPPLLVNPASVMTMGTALIASDGLLMCHEFAHVLLGHLVRPNEPIGPDGRLTDRSQQEELDADLLGARLLFSDVTAGRKTDSDPGIRALGVWLHLLTMGLYERAVYIVSPRTHPPAEFRWNHIVSKVLEPVLGEEFLGATFRSYAKFVQPVQYITPQVKSLRDDAGIVRKRCRKVINTLAWDQQTWDWYSHMHSALRQPSDSARRRLTGEMKRRGLAIETIDEILVRLHDAPPILKLRDQVAAGGSLSRSVLYSAVVASLDDAPYAVRELPRADFVPLLAGLFTTD